MSIQNTIHVAVGVIFNAQKHVLVALRPSHAHQGGLWEFPGGKVEADETIQQALKRELYEEIGIEVIAAKPLQKMHYEYQDKKVLLDVWEITRYSGEARGNEGQEIKWVAMHELTTLAVPAANQAIISTVLEICKQY